MIVFKITVEIKDARIEKQSKKIQPKDVAESFIENSKDWLSLKNTKVRVKIVNQSPLSDSPIKKIADKPVKSKKSKK